MSSVAPCRTVRVMSKVVTLLIFPSGSAFRTRTMPHGCHWRGENTAQMKTQRAANTSTIIVANRVSVFVKQVFVTSISIYCFNVCNFTETLVAHIRVVTGAILSLLKPPSCFGGHKDFIAAIAAHCCLSYCAAMLRQRPFLSSWPWSWPSPMPRFHSCGWCRTAPSDCSRCCPCRCSSTNISGTASEP